MNSSYSIDQANADCVLQMMIVFAFLIFAVDCHLCHDFDLVINVALNRADHEMHCPDLNYLFSLGVRRLRHPGHRLVIKLVVIHVCCPMVDMIRQKL